MTIKVIQVGLGPIGQKVANQMLEKENIEIVGAIDINPKFIGLDLGEILGVEKLGVKVTNNIDSILHADVAVVTTVSSFEKLVPQIKPIIEREINIVSTCEELCFPWNTHPQLSKEIDELAKKHHVSIIGVGVNPGFLMDFLPAVLTGICKRVDSITVSRFQDAQNRRIPFQKKIGYGLSLEEFEQLKEAGKLRHVGLTESMHMIANSLGWTLDKTEDIIEPIIDVHNPNKCLGVKQTGRGFVNEKEIVTLNFKASVGEKESYDKIEITGEPSFSSIIPGGINGDIATSSIVVNAIFRIVDAKEGLRVMTNISSISYRD